MIKASDFIGFPQLVFRTVIQKIDYRIANREDPHQKQSDLGLCCFSSLFWQATSVRNFKTVTALHFLHILCVRFLVKS